MTATPVREQHAPRVLRSSKSSILRPSVSTGKTTELRPGCQITSGMATGIHLFATASSQARANTHPVVSDRARPTVSEQFAILSSAWRRDTQFRSDLSSIILNENYQRIIALGVAAIPLILDDLRDVGPDHWFWALKILAGHDAAQEITSLGDATAAWIAWGLRSGHLAPRRRIGTFAS